MVVSNSLPNVQLSNKEHHFQSTNQLTNNIITPGTTSTEVNYISNNNSSSFINTSDLQPLQNLTSTHMFRCYQCNRDLLPWEWANTCTQCNIVICWQCTGFTNTSSFICNTCRNSNRYQQYSQGQHNRWNLTSTENLVSCCYLCYRDLSYAVL